MSWLSSFLNPQRGYDAAQGQLNDYYNQAQGFQKPFFDALSDPQALQDKWSKGYHESEAAKGAEATASQEGLNAAQQMGLGGSTPALQAIQAGTSGIVANDKQKYLDDLMQKYMQAAGIGQNMGQNAMTMGQNSAQTQFNKTNAHGDLFGKLLGGGVGLFGSALGGPLGGALGAGLSQHMGWSPTGSYNPSPWYTGGH